MVQVAVMLGLCFVFNYDLINIGGTRAVYLFKKDNVSWGDAI